MRRPSDGTVMTLSILATDEEKLKILDSTSSSSASCQCHKVSQPHAIVFYNFPFIIMQHTPFAFLHPF